MPGPAVTMREIHRLRRFIHELQEQLDRAPRQLRAQQAKVTRQEEALREAQDAVKHAKVQIHQKEVSLKSAQDQIAKFQKQLNTAESKKEYDALQAEIKHARADCQKLEDDILAAMLESDERAARVPEQEKAIQQARGEVREFEKGLAERQGVLQSQMAEAQARLTEVETAVPERVRTQFERIVKGMGPDGLAAVRGRTCSACSTEITAQNYNDLLQENFVVCKACGRILYLPEQPPGEGSN